MSGTPAAAANWLAALLSSLGCHCVEDALAPRLSDEEFERLLRFLAAVPLFRKQLPQADLPIVAKALKRTVWEPGDRVVEQGSEGKAFFIIQAGEAAVVVTEHGMESERATLYNGDYFGGHTLTEKRPNVATVRAKGHLVTLSMSRRKFTEMGLHKKLKFPRRPAIYDGRRTDGRAVAPKAGESQQQQSNDGAALTPADVELISKVLKSNQNLRHAFWDVSAERIQQIAQGASRRSIQAGSTVACAGDLPTDFYIVAHGSFDVISGRDTEHKSVESAVANDRSVRERWLQKERFLHDLSMTNESGLSPNRQPSKPSTPTSSLRSKSVMFQRQWSSTGSFERRNSGPLVKRTGMFRATSQTDDESPFKEGDFVAHVGGDSLTQEVGRVDSVTIHGRNGEVVVDFFSPSHRSTHKVRHLRPVREKVTVATLKRGDTYGELALLYNARLVTTCRAREDSEVYAISRWRFKDCFRRHSPQLEDHCQLLNEVHLLTPLLQSERWELARHAKGVLQFEPGAQILVQGQRHREQLFYVIKKGSCIVRVDTEDEAGEIRSEELAKYQRGGSFGERMILKNDTVPDCSVDAGPDGVSCLAIDGQILQTFWLNASGLTTDFGMPGMETDVSQYHQNMPGRRTHERLHVSFQRLENKGLLGEGGFGAVFLVSCDGNEYALKRISKGYAVHAGVTKQICLERDVLSMLDSNFIVRLHQTFKDEQYVYILMELAIGGHLYQLLSSWRAQDGIKSSAAIFYVASVSYALEHLHERHIAYRDLKLENVLLDSQGYVKLCDMGFAKFILTKSHTLCGTPEYMAPEMIDTPHAHDHTVDWWALGVMTFELLTGQIPWDSTGLDVDEDPSTLLLHIRSCQESIPDVLIPPQHQGAKDFVRGLLCVNVKKRLGARMSGQEVRQDSWFRNFDFDALLRRTMPAPCPPMPRQSPRWVPPELNPSSAGGGQDPLFLPYEDDGSNWDAAF